MVAGTTWFITLSALLLVWIARGLPTYPDQSNPYVAFISDIGAFQMKPLFLVGGLITAISFFGTVASVHFARYDSAMYAIVDYKHNKILSVTATLFGMVSAMSLVLLVTLDTYRHHEAHVVTLQLVFFSLAASAACTIAVYSDQLTRDSPFPKLRRHVWICCGIVLLEVLLSVPFFAFIWLGPLRAAGVLEWIITFVGCFYIWNFVGFVRVPDKGIDESETRPLLVQPTANDV